MASGFVCFTALYNFKPQQYGEIELKVGDVVCVKIPYDIESWVEGENKRTKQHGLLPGTYLKELPGNFYFCVNITNLNVLRFFRVYLQDKIYCILRINSLTNHLHVMFLNIYSSENLISYNFLFIKDIFRILSLNL